MDLYYLLPPLFKWEDIPDPNDEHSCLLNLDVPLNLTPVLHPPEAATFTGSIEQVQPLLDLDVPADSFPILQPENFLLPDSQSVTISETGNGDFRHDFPEFKDGTKADENSTYPSKSSLKVQVKKLKSIKRNAILSQFIGSLLTDCPRKLCVEENGSLERDSDLNDDTKSEDTTTITESTATSSTRVPSEVLLESDTHNSSNTNSQTTASYSPVDLHFVASKDIGFSDLIPTLLTILPSSLVYGLHVRAELTFFIDPKSTLKTGAASQRLGPRLIWEIA